MKYLTSLIALLLTSCGMLHPGSSATPFGQTDSPPLPYAGLDLKPKVQSVLLMPPQPITIPLKYPADASNYIWIVLAAPEVDGPWTQVGGTFYGAPIAGTPPMDVPGYGDKGFYKIVGVKK